jgi:HAD superfamily hydrolase (TIGR01549 family)
MLTSTRKIQGVCFDVGETLIDETREYGTWADWLGVPRHTFSAVFGQVIANGQDYREAFQLFRPGFNLTEERQKRVDAGKPESFTKDDMYPDAASCLNELHTLKLKVGIAGNQTERAEKIIRSFALPVDVIGTSASWEVEKPSVAFFERLAEEMGLPMDTILYVGDRLDNDIEPIQNLGMPTALIKRGPWGYILTNPASAASKEYEAALKGCLFTITGLDELAQLIVKHNLTAV